MGRPKTINVQYLNRLQELVSHSPREYGYPFERWTAKWLGKHLSKELGIGMSDRYISMLLKEMGLSTRSRSVSPGESQSKTDATDISQANNSIIAIRDLPSSVEAANAEAVLAIQSYKSVIPL